MQLAKRALAGCVGIDGFLGPSEILMIADESGKPEFIAADLLAQAEHDPGSCFLLTTSKSLAEAVRGEIEKQLPGLSRRAAAEKALDDHSAIIVGNSMDELIDLADRFAAEHVNLQTKDDAAVLSKLKNAGAVFVGPYSPVAAGDYVAGPSHCLPTNTTARFSSGISVYEFLKRSSVVKYEAEGLAGMRRRLWRWRRRRGWMGMEKALRLGSKRFRKRIGGSEFSRFKMYTHACETRFSLERLEHRAYCRTRRQSVASGIYCESCPATVSGS